MIAGLCCLTRGLFIQHTLLTNLPFSQIDAAIGGFMVPNEGISWSKDLRDFQLPITEIERVSGLTFYPQLDRQRTDDLCQADTCNLMKVRSSKWFYEGIQSCRVGCMNRH